MNIAKKMITARPAIPPNTPPTTVDVEGAEPFAFATVPAAAVDEDAALELVVAPTPPPITAMPAEVDAGRMDEKVDESSDEYDDDDRVEVDEDSVEELEDSTAKTVSVETVEDCLVVEAVEVVEELAKTWLLELRLDITVVVKFVL
jgi:hypothetical protein